LFIRRDIRREEWHGDSNAAHTHPMISRYLMGGWLWLQGYDERRLPNRSYRWSLSLEENRRQGRVPSEALLAHARAPMVASGAGAIVVLYLLGRVLAGVTAGLVTAGLAIASPSAQEHLVRARPDPPFAFFFLLALLLGVLGVRRRRDGGLAIWWAVAVGLALGLAVGSKLTAVLSLATVVGWGMLVAILAARRRGAVSEMGWRAGLGRAWVAGRGWALAVTVAGALFVASNPHLYPDPVLHTIHLFAHRAEQGEAARHQRPEVTTASVLEGVRFVLDGSVGRGSLSGSRGLPIEAALAAAGTVALAATTWRAWWRSGDVAASGLVLVTTLAYVVGTVAFLPVMWGRYLLPTVLLGALFSGLGAVAVARHVAAMRAPFKQRLPRSLTPA
jgi:4-amino-4-deoxy-L-arabinose transferase-like glycosyltransferase